MGHLAARVAGLEEGNRGECKELGHTVALQLANQWRLAFVYTQGQVGPRCSGLTVPIDWPLFAGRAKGWKAPWRRRR